MTNGLDHHEENNDITQSSPSTENTSPTNSQSNPDEKIVSSKGKKCENSKNDNLVNETKSQVKLDDDINLENLESSNLSFESNSMSSTYLHERLLEQSINNFVMEQNNLQRQRPAAVEPNFNALFGQDIFSGGNNLSSRRDFESFNNMSNYHQLLREPSPVAVPENPSMINIILNHGAMPFIISIIASILISLDLGYIISNSVMTPFIFWQAHKLISNYKQMQIYSGNATLLSTALMLCGIQQNTITKYFFIFGIMRQISEDFTIYLFMIIMWQAVIGYPNIIVSENDTLHPLTEEN